MSYTLADVDAREAELNAAIPELITVRGDYNLALVAIDPVSGGKWAVMQPRRFHQAELVRTVDEIRIAVASRRDFAQRVKDVFKIKPTVSLA
jgi:hypothetical protein